MSDGSPLARSPALTSQVGIGGHAVSGGFGLNARAHGLTLDRVVAHHVRRSELIAADDDQVALVNGTVIRVSNDSTCDSDRELYWALRGGGGSFGVVVAFEAQTFAAPSANTLFDCACAHRPRLADGADSYDFDVDQATAAIAALQTFGLSNAPAELTLEFDIGKGSQRGRVAFTLAGMYLGDVDGCNAVLAPLLQQLGTASSPTIKTYGWIDALTILANKQPLNSNGYAEPPDNFFEASLMTPTATPMSNDAMRAFASYLGPSVFAVARADSSSIRGLRQRHGLVRPAGALWVANSLWPH